jgi:hypothetical protein
MKKLFVFIFALFSFSAKAQEKIFDSTSFMDYALKHADEYGIDKRILLDSTFRFQMVYSPVVNGEVRKTVSVGTNQYYYPASLVKLPVALLALEKMNRKNISLNDRIVINDDFECGSVKFVELSRRTNIDFKQIFEELLIVSDNDFYNTLYHFITPKEINDRLQELGFTGTRIYKAFTGCHWHDQLETNSYSVLNREGDTVYTQPYSVLDSNEILNAYNYTSSRLFGLKHENEEGKIVLGPYDLNYSLEIPLEEIHEMLQRLVFPERYPVAKRWNLKWEDRKFIQRCLSKYPNELNSTHRPIVKKWPKTKYKYILSKELNSNHDYRTQSKLGLSYGFSSETCFFNDYENVQFFLSVSLYTNRNNIVNDGDYEYEPVAKPFMSALSKMLIEYQLKNVK